MMRKKWQFLTGCVVVLFVAGLLLAGPLAPNAKAAVEPKGKPIRIGFSIAQSGPLAPSGKAGLLAMQICVADFNKKGGVLGRPIELVYYDDHSKPADVPAIYTKLITVDKVDFVVSPYGTSLIAAAMPIIMQHKMVFSAFFGMAVNENFKYKYYFQMQPVGPDPYLDYSVGFFGVAAEQTPKPKTVALLGVDNEFGINATLGAEVNAKKFGFQVIYNKRYTPHTIDYTPIMRAIKATKADILFVASYPGGTVGIIKASKEVGLKPKLFGGGMVGLQYPSIQMNFGPDINGILNYWFWAPEPTLKFPGIEELIAKYQVEAKKQGLDPLGYYAPPLAYAYLELLLEAIEATKSMDQQTVGEYIRNNEFDLVMGKGRFSPTNGEWAKSRLLEVQIQGVKKRNDVSQFAKVGTHVVIYPEKYKSGELIYPFPGWK